MREKATDEFWAKETYSDLESFQPLFWEYTITVIIQVTDNRLEQSDSSGNHEMWILYIFWRQNLQNLLMDYEREETMRALKVFGPSNRKNYNLLRWADWMISRFGGSITFEHAKLNRLIMDQNEIPSSQLILGFKDKVKTESINLESWLCINRV